MIDVVNSSSSAAAEEVVISVPAADEPPVESVATVLVEPIPPRPMWETPLSDYSVQEGLLLLLLVAVFLSSFVSLLKVIFVGKR